MKIFTLERETHIPAPLNEVWSFFSSPKNLAEITPGYMKFKITAFEDREIYEGMLIKYKVRPLLNIPLTWVTKITDVKRLKTFVDVQMKGPFKLWEHTHSFKSDDKSVLMTDRVRYALPFGLLGLFAGVLLIHRQLRGIFDYREQVIRERFGG